MLFALFGDGKAPPNSFKTFQCPFEFMEKRDLRLGYRPFMPAMVTHAGNHDTWKAESGGLLAVLRHPGLHSRYQASQKHLAIISVPHLKDKKAFSLTTKEAATSLST